jgi:DNA-directed RNA polymerase specialized sigma24 family protein
MITASGNEERRCSNCNGLISSDGECPRCTVNANRAELKQPIVDTLKCFILSDPEVKALMAQISSDIESRLPQFLKRTTLHALLPLIEKRAQGFFVAKGVPYADAEELAATLVLKVLQATAEEWPRGNVGAFVATMRLHLLYDHFRKQTVEKKWFGNRTPAMALDDVHDDDEASRRLLLEAFPAAQQDIVARVLDGDQWKDIEADYAARANELRNTILSMEWDGQSVPLRKKRRRGRRSND